MMVQEAFSGKDLLAVEEVAEYLGIKQTTVYRWCREGRMSCYKVGKAWRIRPSAVEEFLVKSERPTTISGQIKQFLDVPTSVIAIAQTSELLHRLDAAFLKVGEERDALLVKFYGGEPDSADELREDFEAHGLDAPRLEKEGCLIFSNEKDPLNEREGTLRRIVEEDQANGREVWVSLDWAESNDLESVLEQQRRLRELVSEKRLSAKTALLERVADDWPMAAHRRAQALHSELLWLSEAGLALSRMVRAGT